MASNNTLGDEDCHLCIVCGAPLPVEPLPDIAHKGIGWTDGDYFRAAIKRLEYGTVPGSNVRQALVALIKRELRRAGETL